jgi:hypothetical protein
MLYWLFIYTFVFICIQSLDKIGVISFHLQEQFFLYITIISLLAFFSSFFKTITSLLFFWWTFLVLFIFFSLNF